MVLIHKIKQMEQIDVEQFREEESETILEEEDGAAQGNDEGGKPAPVTSLPSKRTSSPPRRPLTRSQTGRVPKRRRPDESPPPSEVKKRVPRPRHKEKRTVESATKPSDAPASQEKESPTPPPATSDISGTSTVPIDTPPLNATQLTFLDNSTSPSTSVSADRPGPKSRAVLPVPVPNLTKKSRGRRVPTRLPGDDAVTEQKDARMYVCKVESCGKCFHRGEHLKRHIRSIHTHEKPFKCSYLLCDKHFNRHDNLLQHLKVHKAMAALDSPGTEDPANHVQLRQNTPPSQSNLPPPQLQPYYPTQETYEPSVKQTQTTTTYQQPTSYAYTTPYGSIPESTSLSTNMAISSLRTEIPHSPPSRKQHEMVAHQISRTSLEA